MDTIRETLGFLLDSLKFEYKINIKKDSDENGKIFFCDIEVEDDSNLLIGQHGVNLNALQHIARILVKKNSEDPIRFTIDVNSYRSEKNNSVVEYVESLADRAVKEGVEVETRPMTAYERRLAHVDLQNNENVETESVGDGKNRRVIIRPV